MAKHLDSASFDLPVHALRAGYYTDVYFQREKRILESHQLSPTVTMQVFQKRHAVLCGVDEALAALRVATGRYRDPERAEKLFRERLSLSREARSLAPIHPLRATRTRRNLVDLDRALDSLWIDESSGLEIRTLSDGDAIEPEETVMHIMGEAASFAHLETVYLGILARRTMTASNVRRVVHAAGRKPVLYFPARFDHWSIQEGDGYAAFIGGAKVVSTPAQAALWGGEAGGTIPHALIAALGGDTVRATELFGKTYPDAQTIALVDYDNDCVATALACAHRLGKRLWGVRLDTASHLVDRSLEEVRDEIDNPCGVAPELVFRVREALDKEGFSQVRIIVSGGFDAERIGRFEERKVPVDAYGVGTSLFRERYDFTADVVEREGEPCSKFGRAFRPNPRLQAIRL